MTEINFLSIINLFSILSRDNMFYKSDNYNSFDILTEFQMNDSACTFGSS